VRGVGQLLGGERDPREVARGGLHLLDVPRGVELGLQGDHVRVAAAVEEELVDRVGDVGRDPAAIRAAEQPLVVLEAEDLYGLAPVAALGALADERVGVADEHRDRGRRRRDGVCRTGQLLDVQPGIASGDRHLCSVTGPWRRR